MRAAFFSVSLCLLGSAFAPPCIAAEPYTGYVTYVGTYGSGDLFVGLDGSVGDGACAGARFDVPGDHPQVRNWLAVAMSAYTTRTRVIVKTSGCFHGVPSMDSSRESYLHLMP